MPTVVVASHNPVKIQAAALGFQRLFPTLAFETQGVSIPSNVSHQPMTDAETLLGARNRARGAQAVRPDADYWAGIEGGVEPMAEGLAVFAWVVVRSQERVGQSRTGMFFLPEAVAALVRQGVELGEADDLVFQRLNSKQRNGAIGLLTEDVIDRVEYYAHAVVLALVPFKNPQLYPALKSAP